MAITNLVKKLDNKNLVTVGLILIVLLGLGSTYLYYLSNYDSFGNQLGCLDTLRNIFGVTDINKGISYVIGSEWDGDYSHIHPEELEVHVEEEHKDENRSKKVKHTVHDEVDDEEDGEQDTTTESDSAHAHEIKEVFNIDNSDLTYNDAELICKAYGSELATYQQVVKAHKKGANWCNYGWSKGSMALFPIQQDFYDDLQKSNDDSVKKSCGKPGVNGGKFNNKNLKFGANCYGIKPKADPTKITYTNEKKAVTKENSVKKLDEFKKQIKEGTIEIRPFNDSIWSKYSTKKSTYMLTPKQSLDLVVSEDQEDLDLDPRKLVTEEETINIIDVEKNIGNVIEEEEDSNVI